MDGTENNHVEVQKLKNHKVLAIIEKRKPLPKKREKCWKGYWNKQKNKKENSKQQKQVFVNTTNDIFIQNKG